MDAWRTAVLEEARSWIHPHTPWHHGARIKGAGVDCGQFLIACYVNTGIVKDFDVGIYNADWMFHQEEERYLGWVEKYMDPIDVPEAGDVVLWRFGKCFSHGGIVTTWPEVIHAYKPEKGVGYGDGSRGVLAREHLAEGGSAERIHRFFSIAKRL